MSTETRLTTTVDQHIGTHKTGMRITQFAEVRTDLSDYVPTSDFESMDADQQRDTLAILSDIHDANVALASLDADHRTRAVEYLTTNGCDSFDDVAQTVRAAIRETESD